ncbi:MAG: hypothetical protein ACK4QL_01480 [Pseudanabaenaceae cyanobacterium]
MYDHENRFIGVCATGFYLPKEMNAFLQQLKIGSGTAFIVEGDGRLVASSGTEPKGYGAPPPVPKFASPLSFCQQSLAVLPTSLIAKN